MDMITHCHIRNTYKYIAARMVLSQDIAHEPEVRKAMRRDWEAGAVISVKPTDKGFDQIDDLHPMHVSIHTMLFNLNYIFCTRMKNEEKKRYYDSHQNGIYGRIVTITSHTNIYMKNQSQLSKMESTCLY